MKVALVYHINFNHLSLTFKQRVDYIEKYLEQILSNTVVNSNISICAEDLILLKVWNPQVYKQLITHPKIKFLYSSYSHLISTYFSSDYRSNVSLAHKVFDKEIPKAQIQKIYYPSEVDYPNKENFNFLADLYQGIVLGETKIETKKYTQENLPPFINVKSGNRKMLAIVSRRDFKYRKFLHDYYLDGVNNTDLLSALEHDFAKYAKNNVLTARIDLEVIPFNAPTKNGKALDPPISKFREAQEFLKENKVKFVFLSKEVLGSKNYHTEPYSNLHHDPGEDYKWTNKELKNQILKDKLVVGTPKECLIWQSLLCSDYYYGNFKPWRRANYKDKEKVVSIIKDRKYRDKESKIKRTVLITKRYANNINDKNLSKYIDHFLKAVDYVNTNYHEDILCTHSNRKK